MCPLSAFPAGGPNHSGGTIPVEPMLKSSLKNPALRKRASQFTRLVRHSVVTPRTGETHKPRLVSNGELGVTFIGHSSFFLQIGGQNVVIDPNFARWLFVLKRLRQTGLNLRDLPPMDLVLVTHAHFDHLHRQSLRTIARQTRRQTGTAPTLVVPHHLFDLASDLGFEEIVELVWWNTDRHGALDVSPVAATRAVPDPTSRAKVPMHYATVPLSRAPMEESLQLLDREARPAGVQE